MIKDLDQRVKIEDVRTKKQFSEYLQQQWKDPEYDRVIVTWINEEAWNRLHVMFTKGKFDDMAKMISGEATMEIQHSYGIQVLVNEDYR